MIERPSSVDRALRVVAALSVTAGVITALTWVFHSDLVLAWAEGNANARRVLADGGLQAVKEMPSLPSFVPVVVTSLMIFLMLVGVMAAFFKEGFTWARVCLGVIAVFGIFLAVLSIGSGIPVLFAVLSVVMIVLCLLLLFFLLHRDTSRYFREI